MHIAVAVKTSESFSRNPLILEIAAAVVQDLTIVYCRRTYGPEGVSQGQIMGEFVNFLSRNRATRLIAHDVHYVKSLIEQTLHFWTIPPIIYPWLCTKMLIGKDLQECCHNIGIYYKQSPSALPDAIMCARIYKNKFSYIYENECNDEGLQIINEEDYQKNEEEYNEKRNALLNSTFDPDLTNQNLLNI
jgi:hypothetical protein